MFVVLWLVASLLPKGEVAVGLPSSGREVHVEDGSRGGDVVHCCFVAGSATMLFVTLACCSASCVIRLFAPNYTRVSSF